MATAPVKNVERPGPPKIRGRLKEERRHRKERLGGLRFAYSRNLVSMKAVTGAHHGRAIRSGRIISG